MELGRNYHDNEPDEDGVYSGAYFEGSFGSPEVAIEVESGEDNA